MTRQIFADGHGGKHAAGNRDAIEWRAATADYARGLREKFPDMTPVVASMYAEYMAKDLFRLLDERGI